MRVALLTTLLLWACRMANVAPFVAPQYPAITRRCWSPTSSRSAPTSSCNNKAWASSRSTTLFSLQKLIDNPSSTVFVGGKGGVGKTTISSSIALEIAKQQLDANGNNQRVLIVSTDPAHSLSDCLDVVLSDTPKHIDMMGSTGSGLSGQLYAQEINAELALEQLRDTLSAFDATKLATALQISPEFLESLGLAEIATVLQNPPPGLDELVALSNVFDNNDKFDIVVVDTAPTGHTLRLLALPEFLDSFLGKLIRLRMKLSGLVSTLQAFMGGGEAAEQRQATIDTALRQLEVFQAKMAKLRTRLQNQAETDFVVVSIPTALSVAESKRLVDELVRQNVHVSNLVVNQCIFPNNNVNYYRNRCKGQEKWMKTLQERIEAVSATPEYQRTGPKRPIAITKVPFFDVELVGIPALGYVGAQSFDNDTFGYLLNDPQQRVVICGGKGGVGKTTTSTALAVRMAAAGRKVALISTDPAHSLGDAVNMKGIRNLQECTLIGVPGDTGEGSLSVLEIDPTKSLQKFKGYMDELVNANADQINPGMRDTLNEVKDIFDTLPAGTDEVVALARIVNLVKSGDYDRIVLDTAPTGHTLRMLSTPSFLADLIERLIRFSDKLNSNSVAKLLLGKNRETVEAAVAAAKSKLLSFQFQMYDLEDMFSDAENTEFLIVTVPTELAARESMRLLNDLTFNEDAPIKVRNVVINQVLRSSDDDAAVFLKTVENRQKFALDDLEGFAKNKGLQITKVPYLDTEPRGVYGLAAVARELLRTETGSPAAVQ